jgi:hypothetical protein
MECVTIDFYSNGWKVCGVLFEGQRRNYVLSGIYCFLSVNFHVLSFSTTRLS